MLDKSVVCFGKEIENKFENYYLILRTTLYATMINDYQN